MAVDTQKGVEVKEKNSYPLTCLLVYCMILLGAGYDGASKLVSFLSLKYFTENTYIIYASYITKYAVAHTSSILEKSSCCV